MKACVGLIFICTIFLSCGQGTADNSSGLQPNSIVGTWKLVKATLIEKGDTTVTEYTSGVSFIKIINDTHFAFLQHDLNNGRDSAVYVSGGGAYSLNGNQYTENLEYCSAREWEGHDFTFTIALNGDTLIQSGLEKVEGAGINRLNIEKYVKVKK